MDINENITQLKLRPSLVLDYICSGKSVWVLDRITKSVTRVNAMKAEDAIAIIHKADDAKPDIRYTLDGEYVGRYEFWTELLPDAKEAEDDTVRND